MATSGTITGTCDNKNYTLTCEWSAKQSNDKNTSTITAKVYLKAPSGWSTFSNYWKCTINGIQVTSSKSMTVSGTKVLIGERTWTVTHDSNGECSVEISFSYSNGVASIGSYLTKTGSGKATVKLEDTAVNPSFTISKSTLGMGSEQTITISNAKNTSYTYTVSYTFGKTVTTVEPRKTSSTTIKFTPPTSLSTQIPDACSGICTVKVTTYSGDKMVGSSTKTFTLNVPSSVVPTLTLAQKLNDTLGGTCISGKSTVTITPTGTGAYGSTIKAYSYEGAGLSGIGSSKTTKTLNAGTYTVKVTVTDSRDRVATATTSFTVYPYSNPACSVSGFRADESGNPSLMGTNVRLKLKWSISNPNNKGVNEKKYTIQYKKKTDDYWRTHTSSETLTSYLGSVESWNVSDELFDATSSYDFKFTVTDSYVSVSSVCTVSTVNAVFNIEKDGIGVGKIHEQGRLDVNGAIYSSGNAKSLVMGTGSSDVYIQNTSSNRYLQLKDDGTLKYNNWNVYHAGNLGEISASGKRWGVASLVSSTGLMEIGKTIDFHETNDDTSDYSVRLYSNEKHLTCSGAFYPNNNPVARFGYNDTDKCTFMSNANNNWLRLYDDGTLTWKGANILTESGNQSINSNLSCGQFLDNFYHTSYKRKSNDSGNIMTRIGITHIGTESAMAIEVGKHDGKETFTLQTKYRIAVSGITTEDDNVATLGSSSKRWKAVYASSGYVQTSDERYKFILENIDNEKCFDLIKNTVLYGYSTLNKRIDTYNSVEEISNELKESSKEDVNLHMGFIAQDVEDNELGKYIIRKDTIIDDNGKSTNECIYGIDNYAYTTAIHGALKHEIAVRENEIETLKQQVKDLQQQIKKLSE